MIMIYINTLEARVTPVSVEGNIGSAKFVCLKTWLHNVPSKV